MYTLHVLYRVHNHAIYSLEENIMSSTQHIINISRVGMHEFRFVFPTNIQMIYIYTYITYTNIYIYYNIHTYWQNVYTVVATVSCHIVEASISCLISQRKGGIPRGFGKIQNGESVQRAFFFWGGSTWSTLNTRSGKRNAWESGVSSISYEILTTLFPCVGRSIGLVLEGWTHCSLNRRKGTQPITIYCNSNKRIPTSAQIWVQLGMQFLTCFFRIPPR